MTEIRVEWDEAKNRSNQRKHGLSFEQASQVFRDPLRISVLERIVGGEERWQTFGIAKGVLLLLVAHTISEELSNGSWIETIRIISARPADAVERGRYENENS